MIRKNNYYISQRHLIAVIYSNKSIIDAQLAYSIETLIFQFQ